MDALSVASELFPLVKTGGLADVAGALPPALAAHGIRVRSLLPGYPAVLAGLQRPQAVHDFADLFGGPARLLADTVGDLDILAIDAPHLYARPGNPYTGPDGGDWPDNAVRFAALARVAAWLGQGLLAGFRPAVLHAHDWQTGLAPAYLHFDAGPRPGTLITVHNLAFQGTFPSGMLGELGLPAAAWDVEGVEFFGEIGFLKAGLRLADRVVTVSPTYAAEIRTPESGMRLDGLLRARGDDLSGILNGIGTAVWDPAADPHLAARFGPEDPGGRGVNKRALQARLGLAEAAGTLMLGVISRLSWQKGLDLMLDLLPELMERDVQVVVLGSGESDLEAAFTAAAARWPTRIGVTIGYDEGMARLIQGGADAIVVPSRFEPCGLTQLCAMRYGALPIVSRVGGLNDTVIDANEVAMSAGVATGFQFSPTDTTGLARAFDRAVSVWGRSGSMAAHAAQRHGSHARLAASRGAIRGPLPGCGAPGQSFVMQCCDKGGTLAATGR